MLGLGLQKFKNQLIYQNIHIAIWRQEHIIKIELNRTGQNPESTPSTHTHKYEIKHLMNRTIESQTVCDAHSQVVLHII